MSNKLKSNIDFKRVKSFLAKVPWLIASHAFFACLILFLISLIIGGFLFYKSAILIKTTEFQQIEDDYFLDNNKYRSVLESWEENQKRFDMVDYKVYQNPFEKRLENLED